MKDASSEFNKNSFFSHLPDLKATWLYRLLAFAFFFELGLQSVSKGWGYQVAYFTILALLIFDALKANALSLKVLFFGSSLIFLLASLWSLPYITNHAYLSGLFALFAFGALLSRNKAQYEEKILWGLRLSTILLYFFAFLHKLNVDYVSPPQSCVMWVWNEQIVPRFFPSVFQINGRAVSTVFIWGSLLLEAVLAVCLATRLPKKWLFILAYIFHGALSFRFPLISLIMLPLFLSFVPRTAEKGDLISPWFWNPFVLGALVFFTHRMPPGGSLHEVFILGAWLAPLLYSYFGWQIFRHFQEESTSPLEPNLLARGPLPRVFLLLIVLSGFAPYLGLKTFQSFSMYSNLRVEGGVTNHFFLPQLSLSSRLDELVLVRKTNHPRLLRYENRTKFMPEEFMKNLLDEKSRYFAEYERVSSQQSQRYEGKPRLLSTMQKKFFGTRVLDPSGCTW